MQQQGSIPGTLLIVQRHAGNEARAHLKPHDDPPLRAN